MVGPGAGDQRPRHARALAPAEARRGPRRHVHHHQPRTVRLDAVGAHHQPAADRDPGVRRHREAPGRHRRRHRDPAHGVPVDVVGPPCDRRRDGRAVPRPGEAEPGDLGLRRGPRGCRARSAPREAVARSGRPGRSPTTSRTRRCTSSPSGGSRARSPTRSSCSSIRRCSRPAGGAKPDRPACGPRHELEARRRGGAPHRPRRLVHVPRARPARRLPDRRSRRRRRMQRGHLRRMEEVVIRACGRPRHRAGARPDVQTRRVGRRPQGVRDRRAAHAGAGRPCTASP